MSLLRKFLGGLLSLIPDKTVYILEAEWKSKHTRYICSVMKRHGANLQIASNAYINNPSRVTFGDNCCVNEFVHVLGGGEVSFGSGVWIASHASVLSVTHPVDIEFVGDAPHIGKPVVVEDNVWIGSHAVIMPGVTLGRSCIVGAGAVVTKDVPPYAVVTGIPAEVRRYKTVNRVT